MKPARPGAPLRLKTHHLQYLLTAARSIEIGRGRRLTAAFLEDGGQHVTAIKVKVQA
jgi:hypothetical protein